MQVSWDRWLQGVAAAEQRRGHGAAGDGRKLELEVPLVLPERTGPIGGTAATAHSSQYRI